MKIAIHQSKSGFDTRWISYCQEKGIQYKIVNCNDNNIIQQIDDCDALMWHHSQSDPKHLIMAKPLLYSLEQAGKVVFPNFNTNWHFDDKLGQKYLLEALGLPMAKTTVFYDKKLALKWAQQTTYPVVFKLRSGAGSFNVHLIKSFSQARSIISKSFGNGFSNFDSFAYFKETLRKYWNKKTSTLAVMKSMAHLIIKPAFAKTVGREVGYVYFQEFIPGNDSDIRVIVIGNKAFAIKRLVRKNDFRASGSGYILYEQIHFSNEVIQLAFDINHKLKSQCTAMDFVFDKGKPLLVEISYGFVPEGYDPCPGYWDNDLTYHDGLFDPYSWMVDIVVSEINRKNA